MSLLEQASLCVTPNAYKEDVLYSVVPSDGSGDMNVVRATTATRVNADGLIEVVPKNLLSYSEQFDNASWSKNGVTINANSTIAPDGNSTADTIANTVAGGYINNSSIVGSTGIVYSFSFYIKNNTSTSTLVLVREGSSALSSTINWSESIISSVTNSIGTINFTLMGNGWYRITGTYTSLENNQQLRIYPQSGAGTNSVYVWGAQLEAGSTATSYFPTTDRLNIPRIDYSGGGCPSILVEGQRSNLLLYSQSYTNWYLNTAGGTSTAITLLNGLPGVNISATNNRQYYNLNVNVISGQIYTFSCFIENVTGTLARPLAYFMGSISSGVQVITKSDALSSSRVSISFTPNFTGATIIRLGVGTDNTDTGSFTVSGIQLEAGSYATSYIPTVASSVTRNQDVISKTGISDLIGQTEGTIFVDIDLNLPTLTSSTFFSLVGVFWLNNSFYIEKTSSNKIVFSSAFNSAGNGAITSINAYNNQQVKIAIKYNVTDVKLYINGNLEGTTTLGSQLNVLNDLYINQLGTLSYTKNFQKNNFNSVQLYKTALTDEQLILLTGDSYASYAEMANALNYIIQ